MKVYQLELPDNSPLDVQKFEDKLGISYFLPESKHWIKDNGQIIANTEFLKMLGEHGFIKGENAQIFRLLTKLQDMINFLIEQLHTKTTLFTK